MQQKTERLDWADIAKGISILLVVMWHSCFKAEGSMVLINTLNESLIFLRMPLFFFVSGFFIHKTLSESWSTFLKSKIGNLIYLFLVWSFLNDIVFETAPILIKFGQIKVNNPLIYFFHPPATLWFIFALAIGLIVMKLVRNLPRWLMIPAFLFLYWFAALDGQWRNVEFLIRVARLVPFMYLGFICFQFVNKKIKEYYSFFWPVIFIIPFGYYVIMYSPLAGFPLATFFASILGLSVLLSVSYGISETWIGDLLAYVGKNSLYIYVLHRIPVAFGKTLLFKLNGVFEINFTVGYFAVFFISFVIPLFVKHYLVKGHAVFLFSSPFNKIKNY